MTTVVKAESLTKRFGEIAAVRICRWCWRPRTIRSVVVFPAPFGPRKPVIVPASTVRRGGV